MLPDVNLDTEVYEDIVDDAISRIAGYNPEWTDYNSHDPGVTLLETFAWLKEIQQYTMNQIGEAHYLKYLTLLGTRRKRRRAAITTLNLKVGDNVYLPKGTRFYGGGVPFETEREETVLEGDVRICIVRDGNTYTAYRKDQLNAFERYEIHPFGERTKVGNEVYVGFTKPWLVGIPQTISIQVFQDYPVKRNKINTKTWTPIAKLSYEYYTRNGWKPLEVCKDETHGFLTDGNVSLCVKEEMKPCKVDGEAGYFIRMGLMEDDYEVPPIWTRMGMNSVLVKQKETIVECRDVPWKEVKETEESFIIHSSSYLANHSEDALYFRFGVYYYGIPRYEKGEAGEGKTEFRITRKGYGNIHPDAILLVCYDKGFPDKNRSYSSYGFPNQTYDLEDVRLLGSDFRILVSDKKGFYREWRQVDDLDHSGKTDRHFMLEEEAGLLRFGDGFHGMPPEGEVRIIGYARTFGREGNVKAGSVNHLPDSTPRLKEVTNLKEAVLGQDAETVEECFIRARKEAKDRKRAVTYGDYEGFVYDTPGLMIESCKVVPAAETEGNTIAIAVKPYSKNPFVKVNAAYHNNIINHLEDKRMVGTKIRVLSPEYIGVTLFTEVKVKAHYRNVRKMVTEALEDYFASRQGAFGATVSYHRIYGILDQLDPVIEVFSLTMDVKGGNASRNENADVLLPPGGMVRLLDVNCICHMGESDG